MYIVYFCISGRSLSEFTTSIGTFGLFNESYWHKIDIVQTCKDWVENSITF